MKPAQFYVDNSNIFNENNELQLPISKDGFDDIDITFNTVTHIETTEQQFHKLMSALFMYQCLCSSSYFDKICTEGTCRVPEFSFHYSKRYLYNNKCNVRAILAPRGWIWACDGSLEPHWHKNDQGMNLFWFARAARPQRAKMCFLLHKPP